MLGAVVCGSVVALLVGVCAVRVGPEKKFEREVRAMRPRVGIQPRHNPQIASRIADRLLFLVDPSLRSSEEFKRRLGMAILFSASLFLVLPWFFALLIGTVPFTWPLLRRNARETSRIRAINRELIDCIDLLIVATSAGMSLVAAWKLIDPKIGTVKNSWRRVTTAINSGVIFDEALEEFRKRLNCPSSDSFVRALINSNNSGMPLRGILEILRDEADTKIRHQSETIARRAPVTMLFPLVTLILPSFILLTVVPIVASEFSELSGLFR